MPRLARTDLCVHLSTTQKTRHAFAPSWNDCEMTQCDVTRQWRRSEHCWRLLPGNHGFPAIYGLYWRRLSLADPLLLGDEAGVVLVLFGPNVPVAVRGARGRAWGLRFLAPSVRTTVKWNTTIITPFECYITPLRHIMLQQIVRHIQHRQLSSISVAAWYYSFLREENNLLVSEYIPLLCDIKSSHSAVVVSEKVDFKASRKIRDCRWISHDKPLGEICGPDLSVCRKYFQCKA